MSNIKVRDTHKLNIHQIFYEPLSIERSITAKSGEQNDMAKWSVVNNCVKQLCHDECSLSRGFGTNLKQKMLLNQTNNSRLPKANHSFNN